MFDVTYGNVTAEEAERLAKATGTVDGIEHEAGSSEPWVSQLVADFIVARGARTVLETGTFTGATTVYIMDALSRLGGGDATLVEVDAKRRVTTRDRIGQRWGNVGVNSVAGDVLWFLKVTDETYDLAWIDDCHEKPHVTKELTLLYPKMNPGGLILLHDVYGVTDLRTVVQQFGGYSIDFARLGPAGGLGIIQVSA